LSFSLVWVVACGSDRSGANDADAAGPPYNEDAGGGTDAFSSQSLEPSIVLVDGLVLGAANDTAGKPLTLDDVRVCLHNGSNGAAITPHALPDAMPMPLTNYAGVQRGGGIDLGNVAVASVRVDVYSAADLASDAAWVDSKTRQTYECQTMSCNTGSLPCRAHASFTVTLTPQINVLALVDDEVAGVKVARASFDDVPFAGAVNDLWGTVMDFSGWHKGSPVGAFFGNFTDGSGQSDTIANPLVAAPSAPAKIGSLGTYDGAGVRFDSFSGQQPFDRFGQSLDSIAFVSNPAVSPPDFYGVRENFVVALVGDPTDPASALVNGGRNPKWDGRGLHIVAVPYATQRPAPP
jgi:hypothetical protein